ncbi:protein adenylyltransferase SelO family protein [Oceanicaulis sp. UBA2681]|uniref:protein adenylyltransferase SelO family protein n=1 Tax=Oceanicaulis sp. UBA2681 TaxID=1947007 RepID=UPI00257E172D|nr:YdiU family protein [Oceanicaulis sp. UBA2681]|tara:strand:- start:172 stop:1614 length:1443 start_codon:yes stop_codon:yes gene_type:complete
MSVTSRYKADPRFAALGDAFSDTVEPADFPKAHLRWWNARWAQEVGLEALDDAERQAHFHRFSPLPDNQAEPRALRYHGHQFRVYNPQIGDGRGFLHAQLRDSHDRLLDLGTKGSGQTPYSRSGDGRLTLKGAVREVLASEMLEALGVYTSKTFAVFETGEQLHRGDEPSPTRSAVMTRLQHSHLRFGVFQRHAYHDRTDLISELVEYAIENLVPEAAELEGDRATALLEAVVRRSATLAAQWMAAGFVHGVLNTDNLVVTGESFDYGPWRFLPYFEPGFTAAYFDEQGLYAYARQPESVFWALQQLAAALSLVGERDGLIQALERYPELYKREITRAFHHRLGVEALGDDSDGELVSGLLNAGRELQVPFEALFFDWFGGEASRERALHSDRSGLYRQDAFTPVIEALSARTPVRPERLSHSYFQREDPVHMTIDHVEGLWAPIAADDDWSAFEQTLADVSEARRAYDLGRDRIGFLSE